MSMYRILVTLPLALLVSCGQQERVVEPKTKAKVDKLEKEAKKELFTTVVDLNKVTKVFEATENERRWVESLKKGLNFEGGQHFAQLTDCPVVHKGRVISDAVYFIEPLNIFLVTFENQNVCIVPKEERVGLFFAGSRYSTPGGKAICFLNDQHIKPGIHMKINDEDKRGCGHLPAPQIKDMVAKWRYE